MPAALLPAILHFSAFFRTDSVPSTVVRSRTLIGNTGGSGHTHLEAPVLNMLSWRRPIALAVIVLVPFLAVAVPAWCFGSGAW